MLKSKKLQHELSRCWTTQDLRRLFRVTVMTIHNWRTRKTKVRTLLPAIIIDGAARGTVRFVPAEVRWWAAANKIKLHEKGKRK